MTPQEAADLAARTLAAIDADPSTNDPITDHFCEVCGRPACVWDGICGFYLCSSVPCLDAAWDRAFPPIATETRP